MKVVLLGKHKRSAVGALEHLVARGCEVAAVVSPPEHDGAAPAQRLDEAAQRHRIPLASDDELYAAIDAPGSGGLDLGGVDLVLSFLFWRLIRAPLIELGRLGCLNFHPAPLPDMRGVGGYNVAVLEGLEQWGVSAHFVDERFDTGELVRVERFAIDTQAETAFSLHLRSQEHLLEIFRWTIDRALTGEPLPREAQGEGRYVDRAQLEAMRRVAPADPPELTERRIRAFWYPPYDGATIELGGRTLTLVDRRLLAEAAAAYREAGVLP